MEQAQTRGHGVNLQALYEQFVRDHGYGGSYKSVQRYARARFPKPKLRTRRRVETGGTGPGGLGRVSSDADRR